ncbi:MlaA family lipoprotein [Tropicimonas sp. S265A]|uniref:MlaA family lipoprotein n=1 Tax=Tropicimonas sp. S265A TaxID=3415134 RepID=UPI003C7B3E47
MPHEIGRLFRICLAIMTLGVLGACATSQPPDAINDPFEGANRSMHAFNKGLDRAVVRDASRIYVTVTPDPVVQGIANFFSNVGEPLNAVNNVFQADIDGVTYSTLRFLTNSTIGIGGLFDVASEMGIPEDDTDFGETMYVWGVAEGPYLEVPFFGPQTTRRFVGRGVDIVLDPLGLVLGFFDGATLQASLFVLDALKIRDDRRAAIDAALYDSVDSYAQARIVYLQNRRFRLGSNAGPDYLDPYEDPFSDVPLDNDLFVDPYEDPYAQ